jgi:hypothetical protein
MNPRTGVDSRAVEALARPARRGTVAPSRQGATARPPVEKARNTTVPWLPVVIVIGALIFAGVLIVVLARLVALPALDPGLAPGPAPLSHSQKQGADESESYEWAERPEKYAR